MDHILKGIFPKYIIGYDRLKLYFKIYTPQNEILGTPLLPTSVFQVLVQSVSSLCEYVSLCVRTITFE